MMKLKTTQTAEIFEKNFPKMIISLESRNSNDSSIADTRTVKYTKIKFFEYGYSLVDPFEHKSKFYLAFSKLNYNKENNSIEVKFHDLDHFDKKMAINGRGKNKVDFGYNSNGDHFTVWSFKGLPIEVNQVNKVFLSVRDQESGIVYFLGREGNSLKGYRDEEMKTPFYMFVICK